MSAIAIRPVSSLEELVGAYVARNYQLLIVSDAWTDVKTMAKRLAQPTDTRTTLVVSSLARRVHENAKRGEDLFAGPTVVVLDEAHCNATSLAWARVQEAARASAQDVVFIHVSAG